MTEPALPLRLTASRLKWTLLLLLSVVFVSGGIWIAPQSAFVGYSSIVFFGLGVVIGVLNLLPNSAFLVVDVRGFTFAALFRQHFVPWSHVERFVPAQVAMKQMVGWNYSAEYRKARTLRTVNTALAGAEAALPDTYGKSAAESIELLESCRARYATPAEPLQANARRRAAIAWERF